MEKLRVTHVAKAFEDKQVLKDVNITLREKEIVSLLGVSGVGKTTLFHIIAGLTMPDEGQVVMEGEEITGKPG